MPDQLFKTGYDQLVTTLQAITGLKVFDDPRTLNPPCALVEAPTISLNTNVNADMEFRVVIIAPGIGDNHIKTPAIFLNICPPLKFIRL